MDGTDIRLVGYPALGIDMIPDIQSVEYLTKLDSEIGIRPDTVYRAKYLSTIRMLPYSLNNIRLDIQSIPIFNLPFDGGGGLMCPPKVFLFFYQKSLPLTKP